MCVKSIKANVLEKMLICFQAMSDLAPTLPTIQVISSVRDIQMCYATNS